MADREQLLKNINEVSFAVNDVMLYLDTHPTDQQALQFFDDCMAKRKQALEEYEQQFYPLTAHCIKPDNHTISNDDTKYPGETHWTWADGPAPWEGGVL